MPDLLLLALILFPGFLTERTADYFAASPKIADVQLVVVALAATLLNLGITLILLRPLMGGWLGWRGKDIVGLLLSPSFVAVIASVSITSGIAWAYIDAGNWIFRALNITDRISRADAWDTAFLENRKRKCPQGIKGECPWFVRIITKDGEIYHGNPARYSQGGAERAIYLDFARREVLRVRPKSAAKAAVSESKGVPDPREAVVCLPVGEGDQGNLLVLREQIRLVEFRPWRVENGKLQSLCPEK